MGYSIWGRKRVGQQLNNNNLFICQKIAVSWTEVSVRVTIILSPHIAS